MDENLSTFQRRGSAPRLLPQPHYEFHSFSSYLLPYCLMPSLPGWDGEFLFSFRWEQLPEGLGAATRPSPAETAGRTISLRLLQRKKRIQRNRLIWIQSLPPLPYQYPQGKSPRHPLESERASDPPALTERKGGSENFKNDVRSPNQTPISPRISNFRPPLDSGSSPKPGFLPCSPPQFPQGLPQQ